ncbi:MULTISPECIES: hypothetical protein [unclassified Pseudomonas]|uniref:hypothetical protein n=1 Tax=unclassified Pseudomonas TaxID=196821 RepID=UPI001C43BA7C|nr:MULTISPECIES: hypothetical protein [unclassified Pseudomonas]
MNPTLVVPSVAGNGDRQGAGSCGGRPGISDKHKEKKRLNSMAFAITLLSVCMHAGWNLLGKKQAPSLSFFILAIGTSAILFSPLLSLGAGLDKLPAMFWWLLLATGLCQMLYMGGLAWAYSRGDVSVIYPLARALPVVMVPMVTVGLLGSQALVARDWYGIVLIVLGALCLPLSSFRSFRLKTYFNPALGYALLAAAGTVGYSVIDKVALDMMVNAGFSRLTAGANYMVLQALTTVLWGLPLIAVMSSERTVFAPVWREHRRSILVTGLMITATYGLVLIAMAFSTDVSYIVALRQLSIPVGVLIGVVWLKETAPPLKIISVAVMLLGLLVISLR